MSTPIGGPQPPYEPSPYEQYVQHPRHHVQPTGYMHGPAGGYQPTSYAPAVHSYHPQGFGQIDTRYLASRWKRLGAALIDSLAIGAVSGIIGLLLGVGSVMAGVEILGGDDELTAAASIVSVLIAVGLCALNQIVGLGERGRTLGKAALGMRVVSIETQQPMDTKTAFARFAVFTLPGTLPRVGGLFNLVNICFIFRSDKRTIHDLVAKTIVINR